MPFFENVHIKVPVEINAPPEKVFEYLTGIVDDAGFKKLNADNISFRWLKGEPWCVGSIACAKKILHGKPHSLKFVVRKIVTDRHIEYVPVSKITRIFFSNKEFLIERTDNGCLLTSSANFRTGWIGKKIFGKSIREGLTRFEEYLKEEGKNLKNILEKGQSNG
jgi:hypothetical protein